MAAAPPPNAALLRRIRRLSRRLEVSQLSARAAIRALSPEQVSDSSSHDQLSHQVLSNAQRRASTAQQAAELERLLPRLQRKYGAGKVNKFLKVLLSAQESGLGPLLSTPPPLRRSQGARSQGSNDNSLLSVGSNETLSSSRLSAVSSSSSSSRARESRRGSSAPSSSSAAAVSSRDRVSGRRGDDTFASDAEITNLQQPSPTPMSSRRNHSTSTVAPQRTQSQPTLPTISQRSASEAVSSKSSASAASVGRPATTRKPRPTPAEESPGGLPGTSEMAAVLSETSRLPLRFGDSILLQMADAAGKPCFGTPLPGSKDGSEASFSFSSPNPVSFQIFNPRNLQDRDVVRHTNVVSLCTVEEPRRWLSLERGGRLACERTDVGSSKRCRWAIWKLNLTQDTESSQEIRLRDRIALQSMGRGYLTCQEDLSAHANSHSVDLRQSITVLAAGVPLTPAWSRLRPPALQAIQLYSDEAKPAVLATAQHILRRETGPQRSEEQEMDSETPPQMERLRRRNRERVEALNRLPPEEQEHLLVRDFLYGMTGIAGEYLYAEEDPRDGIPRFVPEPGLRNTALVGVLRRLLPVCDAYLRVSRFVERQSQPEYGVVNQALCSAIRKLLNEYLILVAQLETQFRQGGLTLLKVLYYTERSAHMLERVSRLGEACRGSRGGETLNKIFFLIQTEGDGNIRELYTHLLSEAAQPYLEMLEAWLYHGRILEDDPCAEFQILARSDPRAETRRDDFRDTFWDERFGIRDKCVPVFLRGLSEKILITGKYLNVIRECREAEASSWLNRRPGRGAAGVWGSAQGAEEEDDDGDDDDDEIGTEDGEERVDVLGVVRRSVLDESSPAEETWHNTDLPPLVQALRGASAGFSSFAAALITERTYASLVDQAYQFASRALMDLLLREHNLLTRLKSIKSYFLMSQGDVFVHFMDIAGEELRKPARNLSLVKLRSMLEVAVRSAHSVQDPFKDDLGCYLQAQTLLQRVEAAGGVSSSSSSSSSWSGRQQQQQQLPGHLSGMQAFSLSYTVEYPLSLILSRKSLLKYEMLFRHFFHIFHVQNELSRIWQHQQVLKELDLPRALALPSEQIRHRMIHFVQNLTYYCMIEVIEPNYQELLAKIHGAKTVDELLEFHAHFLNTCLQQCMLNSLQLLKLVQGLLDVCLKFVANIEIFTEKLQAASRGAPPVSESLPPEEGRSSSLKRRKARLALQSQLVLDAVKRNPGIYRAIQECREAFDKGLTLLLRYLKRKSGTHYDHYLSNLYARFDFNDFHTANLELDAPPASSSVRATPKA